MGNRKKYREKFFSVHNFCCFCGGNIAAAEIEHMPSRAMFRSKHRPQGFEFPICVDCNRVSRRSEAIVSFMALSKFDIDIYDKAYNHIRQIMDSIKRHHPALLDEIIRGGKGNRHREKQLQPKIGTDMRLVNLGPITKQHLELFGAKMALAAFYEHTGKPLALSGGVFTTVHTPVDFIEETLPEFPDYFGNFETLKQGRWDVRDQFEYRCALTDNKDAAIFQFFFHQNFLLTSFAFNDLSHTHNYTARWLKPGQLVSVDEALINPLAKYSTSSTFGLNDK